MGGAMLDWHMLVKAGRVADGEVMTLQLVRLYGHDSDEVPRRVTGVCVA